MDRLEAINIIESMYPPDSDNKKTAKIGKHLLEQAKLECFPWRNEADNILIRFAELSREYLFESFSKNQLEPELFEILYQKI